MSNSLHIKRDALAAAYARRTPEQLKDIIHKYKGIIEIGNAVCQTLFMLLLV